MACEQLIYPGVDSSKWACVKDAVSRAYGLSIDSNVGEASEHGFTLEWRYDASFMTEIEVRFGAEGPKTTRVDFEHRNLERYGIAGQRIRDGIDSPEGWSGSPEAATSTPTWDQKGCQYIPHVMGLDVNQHFKVTNSDPTSHNIHPMPKPGGPNHEWNKSQPSSAPPIDAVWSSEEVAIHVKCNIHPWMSGYMVVVKGPYGVSDDKGSFKIENVPPGNYTLTAWQEMLGTQTQKITVAAGKPSTANFSFKAK